MSRCPVWSFLLLLPILMATQLPAPARAATFFVTSTGVTSDADPSDDVCDDGTGACTLRAAIDQANADPIRDWIEFAIPGAGPHSIPDAGLQISQPVVIDGYTQPGSSRNTAATGSNAVLAIALEGEFSFYPGIWSIAPNVELRGLAMRNTSFGGGCVRLEGAGSRLQGSRLENCAGTAVIVQADNVWIGGSLPGSRNLITDDPDTAAIYFDGDNGFVVNNWIGTDASGAPSVPSFNGIEIYGARNSITDNWIEASQTGVFLFVADSNTVARNRIRGAGADAGGNGISVVAGHGNRIGLPSPTLVHANHISGCTRAVRLENGADGNFVQGNRIGVEADESASAQNDYGVWVLGASGNTIGEPATGSSGAGNWIAFNRRGMVLLDSVLGDTVDNSLRANRIWGQSELNLDLGEDFSRNDDGSPPFPPDQDEGPNHLQNPPRITSVTRVGGATRVQGVIAAQAGSYTLDFYSNPDCTLTPLGGGPGGKFHLGEASLSAGPVQAFPLSNFDVTLPLNAFGNGFTATATDAQGNTSEFSACVLNAQAQANLSVEVTTDRSSAGTDDDVVFSVELRNAGPLTAEGVVVQVPRPAGFSVWDADPTAGSYTEGTGEWLVGDVLNGDAPTLTLSTRVALDASGVIEVGAAAGQGSAQVDPDLTDNEDAVLLAVLSGATLRLTQGPFTSFASPGNPVSFRVILENSGPDDLQDAVISGHLAEGLEFEGASPADVTYDPATRRWTLLRENVPVGQFTAVVDVDARIASSAELGQGLRHTVTASAAIPAGATALSTATVGVGAAANLRVNVHREGGPGGLRVEITNFGPSELQGFHVQLNGSIDPLTDTDAICEYEPSAASCKFQKPLSPLGDTASFQVQVNTNRLSVVVGASEDSPYYETEPGDNQVVWVGRFGSCGLIGIEPVLGIGVLAWVRRRRGSRSRRRLLPAALLLLAAVGAAPRSAHALPVVFAVDGGASSASVSLASPLGSPPAVPTALSGSAAADVSFAIDPAFGLVATGLQLTGGALDFSDVSILLASPPLYSLSYASSGVGASLSGPFTAGFPVGPGLSLFDLGGSELEFDAGTIAATGTYFGAPVNAGFDFATLPYPSVFPINSVAQVLVTDLGGGNANVRITLPFSVPLNLVVDDLESTVTVAGTLVLEGAAVIPEPGTALLLGGGLAGLALGRRRVSRGA